MTDEQIREIFMAHGFTIKEGQTDLKPYVYAAARALISASKPAVPMGDGDLVLVERGLLGAACSAIDKKRDAPKVLEKLRAITFAPAAPAQSYCQVHCRKFCQNSVHGECDGAPAQSGKPVVLSREAFDDLFEKACASAQSAQPETDLVLRCKELEELATRGESEQTALNRLANTYRKDISAHDRKAMAMNQTHHEAMRFVIAAPQTGNT